MTYAESERRRIESEATIREIVRLAGIAELSPTAIAFGDIFPIGKQRDEWQRALAHAARIAVRSSE